MEINELEVLRDQNNYLTKNLVTIDEFWGKYKKCKKTDYEEYYEKDFQITMIDNDDEIKIKFKYSEIEVSEVEYNFIDFQIKFLDKNYEYDEDGDCCGCYSNEINTILLDKKQKCRISFDQDGFWNEVIFDSSIASRKGPLMKTYIEQCQREYDRNNKSIRVNDVEAIRDGYNYYSKDIFDINKFFETYKSFPKFGCRNGYEFDITMKCQNTLVKNMFIYSYTEDQFSKDEKAMVKKFYCEPQSNSAIFTFNKEQKCKAVFSTSRGKTCVGFRISDLGNNIYEQSISSYSGIYNKLSEDDEERYGNSEEYMRDNGYDAENDSYFLP